jgi:hypothetical protein
MNSLTLTVAGRLATREGFGVSDAVSVHVAGGPTTTFGVVGSRLVRGCFWGGPDQRPSNPNPCVTALTITANAPSTAGTYRNVTHVVWAGGNFRPVTPLVVVVR